MLIVVRSAYIKELFSRGYYAFWDVGTDLFGRLKTMVLTACTSVLTPGLRSSAARGRAGTRIASVELEDLKTRPFLRVIGIGGGRADRSGDCLWG